jgi:GNAT superfamily N-acetyltransferase
VALEFVDKRRGPFEHSDNFTPRWWDRASSGKDAPWYVQVVRDGEEVGRVELLIKDGLNPAYGVDPQLASTALQIRFFEVSAACRRQNIGTTIIRELETWHPDRALVVYSEADDFWGSLGWTRYDGPPGNQTLFVQQ